MIFGCDHEVKGFPAYMKELQSIMKDWQAFQGDSCCVNDRDENSSTHFFL